jgi:hypothetical protein
MRKRSGGYLIATIEKFPGVQIPLLSDEECKARGIEKGTFPPIASWTPEQQAAGKRLGEALAELAVKQAMRCILQHLEAMIAEGYEGTDPEKDAAIRAIEELKAGKWRASRDDTSGLESEMIIALQCIVDDRGVAAAPSPGKRRRHRKTQRGV